MRRSVDARAGSAGFALAEALASLGLVAMTSLLILSGVGTGRRVWETMDSTAAAGEAVEGAQGVIRARLERLFPASRFEANAPVVMLDGGATSIAFLAPPTQARAPDTLQRFMLSLSAQGELLLTSFSDLAADPARAPVETRKLLDGVRTLDIAYFGSAAPDNTVRWRQDWRRQSYPPKLIRVRVGFRDGDARQWPDLVVRPDATVDDLCVLYVQGARCRGRP